MKTKEGANASLESSVLSNQDFFDLLYRADKASSQNIVETNALGIKWNSNASLCHISLVCLSHPLPVLTPSRSLCLRQFTTRLDQVQVRVSFVINFHQNAMTETHQVCRKHLAP